MLFKLLAVWDNTFTYLLSYSKILPFRQIFLCQSYPLLGLSQQAWQLHKINLISSSPVSFNSAINPPLSLLARKKNLTAEKEKWNGEKKGKQKL